MWDYVGIVRLKHRLERAAGRRIDMLKNEVMDFTVEREFSKD